MSENESDEEGTLYSSN